MTNRLGRFCRGRTIMKFFYGKQQLCDLNRAQEQNFLATNGLGGYASVTSAFGVNRCDMGILVAAEKAPNVRTTLIHRLREKMELGGKEYWLSTQEFADETEAEDGYVNQVSFSYEYAPVWTYEVVGVTVKRACAMDFERNTTAISYTVENRSGFDCKITSDPFCKFAPKEQALEESKVLTFEGGSITDGKLVCYVHTDGKVTAMDKPLWQEVSYAEDAKDGRPEKGMTGAVCSVEFTAEAGTTKTFELIFSMDGQVSPAADILKKNETRLVQLQELANHTI